MLPLLRCHLSSRSAWRLSHGNFSLILCVYVHMIVVAMVEIPITISAQIPVPLIVCSCYLILRRVRGCICTSRELASIVIRNSDGVLFRNKWCYDLLSSSLTRTGNSLLDRWWSTWLIRFTLDNSERSLVVASWLIKRQLLQVIYVFCNWR